MKKFVAFIILQSCVFTNPDKIEKINNEYNNINKNLSKYNSIEFIDLYFTNKSSSENYIFECKNIRQIAMINMQKYLDSLELRKIVLSFDGASGDLISEYFVQENKVFFVTKTKTEYFQSKWEEDFDSTNSYNITTKYYFENDIMLSWIDENGTINEDKTSEFTNLEKEILHDFYVYTKVE